MKLKYNSKIKIDATKGKPKHPWGLGRWGDKENSSMPVTEQWKTSWPLEKSCCWLHSSCHCLTLNVQQLSSILSLPSLDLYFAAKRTKLASKTICVL